MRLLNIKHHIKYAEQDELEIHKVKVKLRELENGEVKLIHTYSESDCSDITNLDPKDLSDILASISIYININTDIFEFSHWEVKYRSEPIPWESDYTDDYADFNIYGKYINCEKSQQHKDLEERLVQLEKSLKYHNDFLEELLK